jgi:hypothetical protein
MKTMMMVVMCSAAVLVSGCATSHSHASWEYKVVTGPIGSGIQTEINKAAADGWVLVSSSGTGNTSDAYAVMNRVNK